MVIRLLGASNHYIQRPYYYAGVISGLSAGLVALGMVVLTLQPMNHAIADFASLYASEFQLVPLSMPISLLLLGTSSALGWFGAFLSVRYHVGKLC